MAGNAELDSLMTPNAPGLVQRPIVTALRNRLNAGLIDPNRKSTVSPYGVQERSDAQNQHSANNLALGRARSGV